MHLHLLQTMSTLASPPYLKHRMRCCSCRALYMPDGHGSCGRHEMTVHAQWIEEVPEEIHPAPVGKTCFLSLVGSEQLQLLVVLCVTSLSAFFQGYCRAVKENPLRTCILCRYMPTIRLQWPQKATQEMEPARALLLRRPGQVRAATGRLTSSWHSLQTSMQTTAMTLQARIQVWTSCAAHA